MPRLSIYYQNILENATSVVMTPAAESAFPVYRLSDRHIGRMCVASSDSSTSIVINQSSSPLEIDTIIIPEGHNLSGVSCSLDHSANGSSFVTALTWLQSGSDAIKKTMASPITANYWRLSLSLQSDPIEIAELFLTVKQTLERNPNEDDREMFPRFNVERIEDTGGRPRYIVKGEPREYRGYQFDYASAEMRGMIETLNDAWAGHKPFWVEDTDGSLIYGELYSPIEMKRAGSRGSTDFKFLEVPR
jgi:hypothetical protein